MISDIRKAIQDAETTLATELRVLASTLAVEQSAADLSEIAAGYRRTHPLRSRIAGLPASLRPADTAILLPVLRMLDDASPAVQRTVAPALRGRSLSEADALALRSVVVLDAALQNYAALADDAGDAHPLAGQWASKLRAAEDAHRARVNTLRVLGRFASVPAGITAIGGMLASGVNFVLTSAAAPTDTEKFAAGAVFGVAIVATMAFTTARQHYDTVSRPVEWPGALLIRAIDAGAVPECILLLRWGATGALSHEDIQAITESLRIREAMLPEEHDDEADEEIEDDACALDEATAAADAPELHTPELHLRRNYACLPSSATTTQVRRLPLAALPPVPEDHCGRT